MDDGVSVLMMGTFGGVGKDNFGEKGKSQWLLLNKIMDGLPRSSTQSPLLNLPGELLAVIVGLLDEESLAALAFVSK
jgi:hypothetical protein